MNVAITEQPQQQMCYLKKKLILTLLKRCFPTKRITRDIIKICLFIGGFMDIVFENPTNLAGAQSFLIH